MKVQGSFRIFHIDALRGWAILMMLQGHFIDRLLLPTERTGWLYDIWKFNRGLTAPLFFTTSGVILVYLLLKKSDPKYRKLRMKKAFSRGLEVLMWGYLLRFNVFPFIKYGRVYSEFWRVDVLHCIGIGLLSIGLIYFLLKKFPDLIFQLSLLFIAMSIFLLHPWYSKLDYSLLPFGIRTYLTREGTGSVFVLFPYLGFLFTGAFIGSLYKVFYEKQKILFISSIAILSYLFTYQSASFFGWLSEVTNLDYFRKIQYNNFGFKRTGQALIFYAIFMTFEPVLTKLKLLNTLGQHTLTIYILHFILLFGSWFALGIDDILFDQKSLTAEVAIPGALVFLILVCWLTLKYHKWKDNGYSLLK